MNNIFIRPIEEKDNAALAEIIRDTLTEFDAAKPGTVYFDSSTDALYQLFKKENAVYNVAVLNDLVAGGAGIFPTEGLPADTCELVKMYLDKSARGIGAGRLLIERCVQQAKDRGFKNIYLETMPELKQALNIYAKFGFQYLQSPLGNTGHTGCTLWMNKIL